MIPNLQYNFPGVQKDQRDEQYIYDFLKFLELKKMVYMKIVLNKH